MVVIWHSYCPQSLGPVLLPCSGFGGFIHLCNSSWIPNIGRIFSSILRFTTVLNVGCLNSNCWPISDESAITSSICFGELLGYDVHFCIPCRHQYSTNKCVRREKFG